MKSFKQFTESSLHKQIQDLGDNASPEKQQAFIDKHLVQKQELPSPEYKEAEVLDLSANRLADLDNEENEEVYESMQEGTVSEAEMTDAQKAKREEIVKELKKKMDEFKDRYGDRATDVMYATATKMAMKDDSEEDEEELDEAKYPKKSKFPSHDYLSKKVVLRGFDKNKKKRLKKSSDYKLDGTDTVKLKGFKGKKLPRGFEEVEVEEGYQEGYYKEGVLQDLEMIVKKKSVGDVKFSDGKKQKVDLTTASMIVSMVKQLNSTNQKKVLNMLDNSKTFKDVAKFAFSAGK
ncbi:hypothetical protein OAG36_00885 [bacterium]|nr:hypothetical protein [bacterium]